MATKTVFFISAALYLGAIVASGVFMYWHNGKWNEALAIAVAVACGLGFVYLVRFLP